MHRTNIEIDEKIVREALNLTSIKTRKELVNYALTELVTRIKRKKMLEIEGKIEWKGDLDELRKSRT